MRVPSEQVRWLSISEQDALGILGTDPTYDDYQDSQAARIRGISKQEWLRRKARADRECPSPPLNAPPGGKQYARFVDCRSNIYGPPINPPR